MAKSADADKLAEEIVAMMPPSNRSRPWWERVAQEHAATIEAVAAGWKSGKYGMSKNRAAAAISSWLRSKGIATVGRQGVMHWLNQLTQ
jgi:hypothetical protein